MKNVMQDIVISDEELARLERHLGPVVRQMGPWISDGVFAYISVPIAILEKAAELLQDRLLLETVCRLRTNPQWTTGLMNLFQTRPDLVDEIVFVRRHYHLEMASESDDRPIDQVVDWQLGQGRGEAS